MRPHSHKPARPLARVTLGRPVTDLSLEDLLAAHGLRPNTPGSLPHVPHGGASTVFLTSKLAQQILGYHRELGRVWDRGMKELVDVARAGGSPESARRVLATLAD